VLIAIAHRWPSFCRRGRNEQQQYNQQCIIFT